MVIAHKTGIKVFVTGGIGGVHRDVEQTLDISADLTELGRTPMAVVSSGVKSVLDIGKTLEVLETQGVTVATLGQSSHFPAFYMVQSQFHSPFQVTTPEEAARLLVNWQALSLESGVLLAVPVPQHQALDLELVERATQEALKTARDKSITGRDVTPYILQEVAKLTGGLSMMANKSLITHNALIGAQVAVKFSELSKSVQTPAKSSQRENKMVVVGGTNIDFISTFGEEDVQPNGATYRGQIQQTFGGVGRNHADALTRLGTKVTFLSALGQDMHAENLQHNCSHMNFKTVRHCAEESTSCYNAILQNTGELIYGIGDFGIHSEITPAYVEQFEEDLQGAPLVLVDGNIPKETLDYICDVCNHHEVPVWFEPTTLSYLDKIVQGETWKKLTYISPNLREMNLLGNMVSSSTGLARAKLLLKESRNQLSNCPTDVQNALLYALTIVDYIPNIILTAGAHGSFVCRREGSSQLFPLKGELDHLWQDKSVPTIVHHPVRKAGQGLASIVSVSGCGDCLNAAMIWCILRRLQPQICCATGLQAAQLSLRSHHAVPHTINEENLNTEHLPLWLTKFGNPVVIL